MHAYLTREHDGLYMLTGFEPEIWPIRGNPSVRAAYIRPGDPLGVRHLCPDVVRLMFKLERDLGVLASVRVEMEGHVIGQL